VYIYISSIENRSLIINFDIVSKILIKKKINCNVNTSIITYYVILHNII